MLNSHQFKPTPVAPVCPTCNGTKVVKKFDDSKNCEVTLPCPNCKGTRGYATK